MCCRNLAAFDNSSSSLANRSRSSSQLPDSIAAAVAAASWNLGESCLGDGNGLVSEVLEEADDEDVEEELDAGEDVAGDEQTVSPVFTSLFALRDG